MRRGHQIIERLSQEHRKLTLFHLNFQSSLVASLDPAAGPLGRLLDLAEEGRA
jgi:hypothetical protein